MSMISMDPTPWAREALDAAPRPLPRYGSSEWEALDGGDPVCLAAVAVAAEAWRQHTSAAQVAEDLKARLAEDNALHQRAMREASAGVREGLNEKGPLW